MKKIAVFAGIIVVLVIAGIVMIKGQDEVTEVTEERQKIGLVCNGSITDGNWTQSHYEGLKKSAEQLNLEIVYEENVPFSQEAVEIMEEMIASGCKIILCNSVGYGEFELQVARKYPDIYFFHAAGVETEKNLTTYFGRLYQMRYLTGIVAGLQTQTNEIGYVAPYALSEVNRGINAFTLGVRSVNPKATVYVEWSGDWLDSEKNSVATNKLFDKHNIDVLAMHSDSLKPLEIADKRGVWCIGCNSDNSNRFPHTYLTAAIWKWDSFYTPYLLECLQGKFLSRNYWGGLDSGMVDLAPLTKNVKKGTAAIIEKEKKKFMNGTYDVFYGPVRDQQGNVRIKEGECMPDEVMLNSFDWFVEGVVIENDK